MKILVVAPRYHSDKVGAYYDFPVGLGYISSCMKQKGHDVECINLNNFNEPVEPALRAEIAKRNIQVCCTGGLSGLYNQVDMICRAAKDANPETVTIAGGGLISSEPELMVQSLPVDVGVVGEGEETIVELLEAIGAGGGLGAVNGIAFKDKDGRTVQTPARKLIDNLDSVPFPDFDGFDINTYLDTLRPYSNFFLYAVDKPRLLPALFSRSCPYNCTFCYHPLGRKYRSRSIDNLFQEIDMMVSKYRINLLALSDELFTTNKKTFHEFCARIKKYRLKWLTQMRVDFADRETFLMLKDAGCCCLGFGLENINDSILKSMNKHINPGQIENALSLAREVGIGIQGNFLFGDPAETRETAMTTIRWWEQHYYYHINMNSIVPYPGCDLYYLCIKNGLIKDRLQYIKDGCYPVNMTKMGKDDLADIFNMITECHGRQSMNADVVSIEKGRYDPDGGHILYTLTVKCPHCGEQTTFKHFYVQRFGSTFQGIRLKIACRSCNQRFDLSPLMMSRKMRDKEAKKELFNQEMDHYKRLNRIYLRTGAEWRAVQTWWGYSIKSRKPWLFPAVFPNLLKWRRRRKFMPDSALFI